MALYFTERDVTELLTMDLALECLEEAFRDQAAGEAVNRSRYRIPLDRGGYNLMSAAWRRKHVVGQKSYVPGKSGTSFHVMLYDSSGEGLLAIFEASRLGQIRTGAASGLATKFMAREDASVAAIIGSGYQARTQLEAISRTRALKEARVFSRSAERRETFAREMSSQLGFEVVPMPSAAKCVDGADIVTTVTNAAEPVLNGELLRPGMHVNAAGANGWLRRELDTRAVAACSHIVTDDIDQAKVECAELMRAVETGHVTWERVRPLSAVVSREIRGRTDPADITLFESQGVALEDVAVAERLYRMALDRGIGAAIPSN